MFTPAVQTALVTGGGSGMGRASVLALAAKGIDVVVADLNPDAALAVADEAAAMGRRSLALEVDVADSVRVAGMFAACYEAGLELQMVVHAAAIMGRTALTEDVTDEQWRQMTAINLDGTFFVAREAVRRMKLTGGGRIALFSSVASLTPSPGAVPYSATKGAVNMMAKSMGAESARHNIRVNAVAPGYIDTPMLTGLPDGFADHIVKKTPLRRLGRAEEIAGLIAFLASPEADFITGQVISPNGGLVI